LNFPKTNEAGEKAMSIAYLTNDLMFSSRVSGAAQSAGAELRVVSSVAGLIDLLSEGGIRLVILDLTVSGLDLTSVLPEIRNTDSEVAVVAYGPHVHEQKLAEAASAGCDQVLSKGQFNSLIVSLIERYTQAT
jgi:DNA-binding response OmpR family regulator